MRSDSDGEELPASVDAFEVVKSAVIEVEPCSRDEHRYGGGHPYFVWRGFMEHPSRDVNGDASDVITPDLHFAGMQSSSHLDTERFQRVAECSRATDCSPRTVEGGEDPVTRGLKETSGVSFYDPACDDVVTVEDIAPGAIAKSRQMFGRSDKVRKQNRSQRAVRLDCTLQTAQELLDVLQARRGRFAVQGWVTSWEHSKLRIRDVRGEILTMLQRDGFAALAVQYKGRDADRFERRS